MAAIYRRLIIACFSMVLMLETRNSTAWAGPVVVVSDKDGDFLQHAYQLMVTAPEDKDVIGVIVVNAFTLFNVDGASPIAAPTDWGFIPPAGPSADGLFYFSNTDSANIKKNTTLGGFIFESTQDFQPFKVDLVLLGGDVQEVVAKATPEPATLFVVGMALFAVGFMSRTKWAVGQLRRTGWLRE